MNPSSLKFRRTGKMTLLFTILCASALNGMEMEPEWGQIANANNQKDFTRLVHLLANKSNISTNEVAQKVNTDTAKEYIEIGEALLFCDSIENLWNDDSDVNYTRIMYNAETGVPFIKSVLSNQINKVNPSLCAIEFLLNHGTKVEQEDNYYLFRKNPRLFYSLEYEKQVKELLVQARLNQKKSLSS